MKELIRLHKIFCLSQHPLWLQICNNYWKLTTKYWTTEKQLISKENCEKLTRKIVESLKGTDIGSVPPSVADEKYLIELMDYYGIDYCNEEGVDKTCFSGILVFAIMKFAPVLNIYTLCIISIACLVMDYSNLPRNLSSFLPVCKEENDFLLWLCNNFTKIQDIQISIAKFAKELNSIFQFSDKIIENKKLILKCRETFSQLLKLKNSEFRTKKVPQTVKLPDKQKRSEKVLKFKLPIQGKAIKLQSPSSTKIQPVKATIMSLEKITTIRNREYHPELLETLVEQYRNYSRCASPEPLSPRIFKSVRGIKTPNRPFAENLRLRPPKSMERSLETNSRAGSRSASTKNIRKNNRLKIKNYAL